jgi:calcineurin-like phosphoesterase family protein
MSDTKLLDGRRRLYFTSDWHIGHANVLVFDKRPFKDLDHMHRVLINNYNATVGPEDLCYFLGDIGLGKGNLVAKVIQELNGTKVCILGNHDKGAAAMRRFGFDVVLNMAAIEVAGQLVTMTHFPLRGVWRENVSAMKNSQPGENWHGETRHEMFSIPDFGQYHLHGHIHAGPANDKAPVTHNQFDVGVAANGYRPVSVSVIESWIARREKA